MTPSSLGHLALLVLLLLTAGTWTLSGEGGTPGLLAALAFFKAAVIGLVFLDMGRSWPGWAALAMGLVALIAGGAALLISA